MTPDMPEQKRRCHRDTGGGDGGGGQAPACRTHPLDVSNTHAWGGGETADTDASPPDNTDNQIAYTAEHQRGWGGG